MHNDVKNDIAQALSWPKHLRDALSTIAIVLVACGILWRVQITHKGYNDANTVKQVTNDLRLGNDKDGKNINNDPFMVLALVLALSLGPFSIPFIYLLMWMDEWWPLSGWICSLLFVLGAAGLIWHWIQSFRAWWRKRKLPEA